MEGRSPVAGDIFTIWDGIFTFYSSYFSSFFYIVSLYSFSIFLLLTSHSLSNLFLSS